MGALECHQMTPPNKMVELNPQAVVKVQIRIFSMDKVEVQVRILLRDKQLKLCQNTNTANHTLI